MKHDILEFLNTAQHTNRTDLCERFGDDIDHVEVILDALFEMGLVMTTDEGDDQSWSLTREGVRETSLPDIQAERSEQDFNCGSAYFSFGEDGDAGERSKTHDFEIRVGDNLHDRLYIGREISDACCNTNADEIFRTGEWSEFLSERQGRYRVELLVCRRYCQSGTYAQVEKVSFSHANDAARFREQFLDRRKTGKQTPRRTSEAVSKLLYTSEEAKAEWERIERLSAEHKWSPRKVAAYKANVSRRVAENA